MNKNFLPLLLLLLCFSAGLQAQDIILKRNNEPIHCKIREIGVDEIKYTLPEYPSDVSFSIDKDNVLKVIFENGNELEFKTAITDSDQYLDNRKNILKIEFLSPLTGNTTFAYERSLGPGRSIEGTLGIIGLGRNTGERNAKGAFIRAGYKFIKDPDFYIRGMRYSHLLKGGYIKPELAFGSYTEDIWEYYNPGNPSQAGRERRNVISGTIQVVIGKQWVFSNVFATDIFGGIGYGFTTDDAEYPYHYGYSILGSSFPMSFSAGFKLGYLFK